MFAYNPALPRETFEAFLASLNFHNDQTSFISPLENPNARITKKPLGIKIAPDNSPITPERFSGYHTAIDFEVFENEIKNEVAVNAFCGGKILQKRTAPGYGGLLVQECLLGSNPMTALYGHLDSASIASSVGTYLAPGMLIGNLGDHESPETDGERKHLHFGLHQGTRIDIRGYVPKESELSQWLNPQEYL